MRIDRVEAAAFGPFVDEALDLAPGMTVVHGPNESGKSSWHAALYAGLCGMRRGRGAAVKTDREFAERHRPWDGDRWRVGVAVTLDDGRHVELSQDLAGQVDCRATDTVLGTDISDEIMVEGAPDGAAFLGLTRRALPATLCIRQADLLGVLDDAAELQEAVQRAAATGGADATAEQALERIARFRREAVGTERANATKPLMTAVRDRRAAAAGLHAAQEAHAAYRSLTVEHDGAQRAAREARGRRDAVRALAAARDVDALAARVAEARRLWDVVGSTAPASVEVDGALDRLVAEALSAHRNRPAPGSRLGGPTSADLEAELAALPEAPTGDLAPHARVVRARRRWERAVDALAVHPPAPTAAGGPESSGASPSSHSMDRRLLGGAGALLVAAVIAGAVGQVVVAGALAAVGLLLGGLGLRAPAPTQTAQRSAIAAAASRRANLAAQLDTRRAAERSAAECQRLHDQADGLLADAAAAAGVQAGDAPAAAAALTAWQADRDMQRQAALDADRAWQRLQFLLDGEELADLEAALAARRSALPADDGEDAALDDDHAAQLDRLDAAVRAADRHADELAGRVADRRRHLPSVAEAEEELERTRDEEARLRALDATLDTAHRFLSAAKDRVHRDIAPRLQASVAARLPAVTAGRYEAVTVDPATLEVKVRETGGAWRPACLLSHGTAEQVYLLLRLALAEHLCTTGESAPLLLDDVTVQADDDRTLAILELLHAISAERQVVLFSQEDAVLDWAEQRLTAPQDALVWRKPLATR